MEEPGVLVPIGKLQLASASLRQAAAEVYFQLAYIPSFNFDPPR